MMYRNQSIDINKTMDLPVHNYALTIGQILVSYFNINL